MTIMAEVVENVKYAGTKVALQNMNLVLPPLNFAAYRIHGALKKLNMIFEGVKRTQEEGTIALSDEEMDAAIDLIMLSAVRNYPEITREQIMEGLDFDTLGKILPCLVSMNSLDKAKEITEKNA
jgi:hypothetical protein